MPSKAMTAARKFFAVALNALGLLVLLAAAWLMPQILALIVKPSLLA